VVEPDSVLAVLIFPGDAFEQLALPRVIFVKLRTRDRPQPHELQVVRIQPDSEFDIVVNGDPVVMLEEQNGRCHHRDAAPTKLDNQVFKIDATVLVIHLFPGFDAHPDEVHAHPHQEVQVAKRRQRFSGTEDRDREPPFRRFLALHEFQRALRHLQEIFIKDAEIGDAQFVLSPAAHVKDLAASLQVRRVLPEKV